MSLTEKAKSFGKKVIGYPAVRPSVVSSKDWVSDLAQEPKQRAVDYVKRLFPIFGWITRYSTSSFCGKKGYSWNPHLDVGWLTGDLIAGLTVGIVLVPQSMSYAQIATLDPQYGLYSAFVGVMIYCVCFFSD